jgi:UDPglucose 6-dehydrogenase
MSKSKKIGIIGYGFVGKAVASSYSKKDVLISDPAYPEISRSIAELKEQCACIFVCVPTPPNATGECDTRILEKVIVELFGYTGIVIGKSTASPHTYERLASDCGLKFAHVPEFLVQATAVKDYLHPHKVVIGCDESIRKQVKKFVLTDKVKFKGKVEYCTIAEASFFKYLANTMLAMKVIINNEYKELADALDIDYGTVANIAKTDPRLGTTHWQVPGPDGKAGFGGACFPKDTAALSAIAADADVDMEMLNTAIIRNNSLRPEGK